MGSPALHETPWDTKVFGWYTAEVPVYDSAHLQLCGLQPGLYTLKLDPLADKTLAQAYGFYYCDTLLIPECTDSALQRFVSPQHSISASYDKNELLTISHSAFVHGRFHRDPNIPNQLADARYDQWLEDLMQHGQVFALMYEQSVAGFVAIKDNALQLHAVATKFRGLGYSKYWWTSVCDEVFRQGHNKVMSSVSASNLAVVNLYNRLGFRFVKSTDVYHKYVS
ncbi:GNAT family N-acetyltransferase [Methylophilus aquaticus]|uniref:GNAT family N-acetyltransferase n=1 Tax=Methylophilus aquaticus TaxID=1971610 RepID=A0ABT9JP60_9PROT|nr:GNAT family N-acetyltransferase [Methylophilus aquaticus]MDP8566374.1 GNAT family N-acetyltransferase [Methylophilus aquaticus]